MTRRRPAEPSRRPGTPAADRDVLGGLVLLEEAFHVLRRTPAEQWLLFHAGSAPFVLYLLYFIADRRQTGLPGFGAALGAALLYCLMKIAQARFGANLRSRLGPAEGAPSGLRHALVQVESQPMSLLVLPAALVVGLPFGWVYAYYQSLAVTGDRRAARRQAGTWPRQNHSLLALLALCSLFVYANMLVLLVVLPSLVLTLVGVQSAGATHPLGMLSSTTAAVAAALTYLAVAPLVRAAYALRCFYRDARRSGDDLRGELRQVRGAALAAGLTLFGLLFAGSPAIAGATDGEPAEATPAAAAPATTEPPAESRARELDDNISRVLERREFAWRLPLPPAEPADGFLAGFTRPILEATRRWSSWIVERVSALFDWLRHRLRLREPDPAQSAGDFGGIGWTGLLFSLALLLAIAGGVLLVLRRRRSARQAPETKAPLAPAIADLMSDEVAAAALPSDRWLAAAHELLARGDARGAVRAAYLAMLALLANEQLVTPSRFKSNLDYRRELMRRTRDRPGLADQFAEGVAAFERVWYGTHVATSELALWSVAQVGRLQSLVR